VATLEIVATGEPQRRTGELTLELTRGLNEVLRAARVPGCVYGDWGGLHYLVGQTDLTPDDAEHILDRAAPERLARAMGPLGGPVRAALLLEGVDPSGSSSRLSAAHSEADVEFTLAAFERALARLRRWEVLPPA
jgi:glutamate-1-semialdehyde 2,1-aminomutase